jgi:hypothetical protein
MIAGRITEPGSELRRGRRRASQFAICDQFTTPPDR